MKKVFLASGMIFLGLATAFGQSETKPAPARSRVDLQQGRVKMSPEQRAALKTDRLDKTVQLTEEQKNRVHAVYLKEAEQRRQRGQLNKATRAEIQSILSPAQNEALKAANRERMAEIKNRRSLNRGALKVAPANKVTPGEEK